MRGALMEKAESWSNPVGLNGVVFVEFASLKKDHFHVLFDRFGFKRIGEAKNGDLSLYQQNSVFFLANSVPGSFAVKFASLHGPSICGMGFRVDDAQKGFAEVLKRGGIKSENELGLNAIFGIGESQVYILTDEDFKRFVENTFHVPLKFGKDQSAGLNEVDHFTNNVPKGEMQKWCDFYEKIFNFRETRYFDIKGAQTGLVSKVMRSPCQKFAVPINEPSDHKSQIQEYLDEYKGSGIQHLALTTSNIISTMQTLRKEQIDFLTPPPSTYYTHLKTRLPILQENPEKLGELAILADGDEQGYLLQIFTKNIIGPIFFELIQRKNHTGFGEGNFQALFDAIERDQRERGYI
jgi:4-hydroxyphenylpyruvate dioxygenase